MNPKISVIIPVYNAEKYLKNCLDSVLSQSFKDFEIILINDGSTDNSGLICDEYKLNDQRIKVFHQSNTGVSAARNKGIENAKGEWITFVDSDDWIGDNYFKCFEKEIEKEIDWILLNINRFENNEIKKNIEFENKKFSLNSFFEKYSLYPYFPGPCGKFFKKEIILKNNIQFDLNLKFGEDAVFNLEYIKFCKYIETYNQDGYFYRNVEGGLSKRLYNMEGNKYLFTKMSNIFTSSLVLNDFKDKNLSFIAHLYFFTIIKSDKNSGYKFRMIKNLINQNKSALLMGLNKDRIHGIKYDFFIKYKLIRLMIFLTKTNNK